MRPGELLVVQADKIDETMGFLQRLLAAHGAGHEIDLAQLLDTSATEEVEVEVYLSQIVD